MACIEDFGPPVSLPIIWYYIMQHFSQVHRCHPNVEGGMHCVFHRRDRQVMVAHSGLRSNYYHKTRVPEVLGYDLLTRTVPEGSI